MDPTIKHVAITGGAGTLGLAFARLLTARQIEVTIVDHSELALVELQNTLPTVKVILSDFDRVQYHLLPKVDYLLHLAAHKHVTLAETNVEEVVTNNVVRTARLFRQTHELDIPTMYMSTDKAVEPTGVYGYSKALGEALARQHNFPIARCGNLIRSTGSVIPKWERQIAAHEPLTITDQQMKRYVIEPDEAARQIWQQLLAGQQLIIPTEMKEYSVMDLALSTLRRHGYQTVEDYLPGLKITGALAAEKQREKLRWAFE